MRKLFTVLTACAAAFALTACGSSTTAATEAAKTEAATEAAKEETTEAAKETEAAAEELAKVGDFPSETITLVCPFSAGGGTDIGARNMATSLSEILGVNVVVENQPGSNGWIAWTDLITGDYKDGYTIGLINHNFVYGELDPVNTREYNLDDVQVLANQVLDYNVMAFRSDESRFTDLESFIEYAKENPVLIASMAEGITDGDSTTAEWFNQTFGTQIKVVPVDGTSDARAMFLAGDTDVYFASVADVKASYDAGEMNVVCVFAEERSSFLPEIPTIKEATGEEFYAYAARGYFYPAGVDEEIVSFMTDAMLKAMEDPAYIENMNALGLELDNTSGAEYEELLGAQADSRKRIWGVE